MIGPGRANGLQLRLILSLCSYSKTWGTVQGKDVGLFLALEYYTCNSWQPVAAKDCVRVTV